MSTNVTDLAVKVALVIGGPKGVGAAIVKRLAADGAAVAFTTPVCRKRPRKSLALSKPHAAKLMRSKPTAATPSCEGRRRRSSQNYWALRHTRQQRRHHSAPSDYGWNQLVVSLRKVVESYQPPARISQ